MKYRHLDDGVVIHSLGHNRTDEGGIQDGIIVYGSDIAFRLLDPDVRGTLPQPKESDEQ